MFIKCAQQLGFKLKELQEILTDHVGDVLPWERADQAIAEKKHNWPLRLQHCKRRRQDCLRSKPS